MDLVLDLGNYRLKGAFFQGEHLVSDFVIPPQKEAFQQVLEGKTVENTLLSSVNRPFEPIVQEVLTSFHLPFHLLDFSSLKVTLDVEEPDLVGQDRIANVYGALYHFPQNDCLVVDLGTAVTFDCIGCEGRYLGGAIYPGVDIGALALANYTQRLPKVEVEKPPSSIAKTTKTHIQSGLYWGLLGAIERITFEMRSSFPSPSNIQVIITGGILRQPQLASFAEDVRDLADLIDPHLTLRGIHEIMKEIKQNG